MGERSRCTTDSRSKMGAPGRVFVLGVLRTLNTREAEHVAAAEASHLLHLVLANWAIAASGAASGDGEGSGSALAIRLRENAVGAARA